MKIYLAGRYGRRLELLEYKKQIEVLGDTVTSRWLDGGHEDKSKDAKASYACIDLLDIGEARCLIAFTEHPDHNPSYSRGGRHVELGYAIGLSKIICIVGPLENVFCYLPGINKFESFEQLLTWLKGNLMNYVRS